MFQTDPFSLIFLFVGLSLLPFVAMVATSYLKIVVVMSLIRNALGIQSIPPNMVINALAMILTLYIMAPVASESWTIAKEELAKVQQPAASQTSQAFVLIGDSLHDKEVADALGARCVLCAQGSHAAWRLRAVAPTGDTLLEALELALGREGE